MSALENRIRPFVAGTLLVSLAVAICSFVRRQDAEAYQAPARASTATVVTCPASVTFAGRPLTPCVATVIGSDGFRLTETPVYAGNVNAGAATATYTYVGDGRHES